MGQMFSDTVISKIACLNLEWMPVLWIRCELFKALNGHDIESVRRRYNLHMTFRCHDYCSLEHWSIWLFLLSFEQLNSVARNFCFIVQREVHKEQQRIRELEVNSEQNRRVLKVKMDELSVMQRRLRSAGLPVTVTQTVYAWFSFVWWTC